MPTTPAAAHQSALSSNNKPLRLSPPRLVYEMLMLGLIIADLLITGMDALLMSNFMQHVAMWGNFSEGLSYYQQHYHPFLKMLGGFFTLFLIVELLVRWVIAIVQRQYYRWFFFPFVHWYEVLGCAPQLRALRLLRAGVIGYRLHQIGYKIIPDSWLVKLKFYYKIVMEEISDRVILTAIENIRSEIHHTDGHLVQTILDKHRPQIEQVVVELLEQEVTPLLQSEQGAAPDFAAPLAEEVGQAIQQSLMQAPELRRAVRMIPIAGGLIESQLLQLGQHIGENLTLALSQNLTRPDTLQPIYRQIAQRISQVNTTSPALEKLVSDVIDDSLTALSNQVKIQQWKHQAAFNPL